MSNEIIQFCEKHGLTVDQFYGRDRIDGHLDLRSVTKLPEGFAPTVGRDLYLSAVMELPEGFAPTVGRDLYLSAVMELPEGFAPTVGRDLYLSAVMEEFDRTAFIKPLPLLEWQNGKYIRCDDRFSEVVHKRGNVWKLKDIGSDKLYYIVTDEDGRYAHGDTVKEAREDLIYKLSNRDKSEYESIDPNSKLAFKDAIEMYRVITGACDAGVKHFLTERGIKPRKFSPREIAEVTKDAWGGREFQEFLG